MPEVSTDSRKRSAVPALPRDGDAAAPLPGMGTTRASTRHRQRGVELCVADVIEVALCERLGRRSASVGVEAVVARMTA